MLATLVVPSGTRRVPGPPVRVLDSPYSTFGSFQLVDVHQFLSTPGLAPSALEQFLERHVPTGMRITGNGTGGDSLGTSVWEVTFGLRHVPSTVAEDQLIATIAAGPSGRAAWRVDADVVWQAPHPTNLVVPADVPSATVARTATQPRPSVRTVELRAGPELSAIARTFDRLPVAVPGARSCPMDLGVRLQVAFPATSTSPPIVATVDDCADVDVTVDGRVGPVLRDPPAAWTSTLAEKLAGALGYHSASVWR